MNFKLLLIGGVSLVASVASQSKVIVGYYLPSSRMYPQDLPFDKVTHINYGFGYLFRKDKPASIFIDGGAEGSTVKKVRALAGAKGVKVLLSIGGKTGSQTLSTVAASTELRKQFIDNILFVLRANTKPIYEPPTGYDLNGVDIAWEHPGRAGVKCNFYSPQDSINYLILVKELRAAMDAEFPTNRKLLTATVRVQPFDDINGKPMKNLSEYVQYFDFINVMSYDIMGPWSNTTGPNAPFNYDSNKGGNRYSFTQSIDDWLSAGFPASKINAGLSFHGRSSTAQVDMDADPANQYVTKDSETPKGDQYDNKEPDVFCNEGSQYSGVYKYKYIRKDILTEGLGSPSDGYKRHWDSTTKTPWLFKNATKHFISYDDPESLKVKVDYAKSKDLRGVMCWDLTQDINNELLDVVQEIRT